MPQAAPRPCTYPGCGRLVRGGSRCEAHKVREGSFADKRRGSRHERSYGSDWDKRRVEILQRDKGLCQVSLRKGLVVPATQVDHIINKAEWRRRFGTLDGVDDPTNLQAISAAEHRLKTQAEAAQGRGGSKV